MNAETFDDLEVRRLVLKPGDQIVIKGSRLTREMVAEIRASAENRWPGYPITVLNDLDIDVIENADPS
jgi:signal peptidase I